MNQTLINQIFYIYKNMIKDTITYYCRKILKYLIVRLLLEFLEYLCRKGWSETSKYRHTKFPTSGIFSKRCVDLQIEMFLAVISAHIYSTTIAISFERQILKGNFSLAKLDRRASDGNSTLHFKKFIIITKRDSDGNMPYYFPYLPLDMRYHISSED